jgi:transcription elongation factor S-II|tara:strand:+ start:232 stop:741 length:510 start_codon:yes stop_codon:yes gene_type:complete
MHSIVNPSQFRKNICDKLLHIVGDNLLCINLEKGVFNYALKEGTSQKIIKKWDNPIFVQLYLDRLRSIYMNLKNEDLLLRLKKGEVTPQTLAFMTHQEMNLERWKELIEHKIKRDATKYTTVTQASTDMFTCKKCKSKKCTYYELQTRSADEPATIFVTCLDCGKNWKS